MSKFELEPRKDLCSNIHCTEDKIIPKLYICCVFEGGKASYDFLFVISQCKEARLGSCWERHKFSGL